MEAGVFRSDIQGLRAVAVLAVMAFHLNPAWLPGGFVGVDIFLVISGFLISNILLHKSAIVVVLFRESDNRSVRSGRYRRSFAYAIEVLPSVRRFENGGLNARLLNDTAYFFTLPH